VWYLYKVLTGIDTKAISVSTNVFQFLQRYFSLKATIASPTETNKQKLTGALLIQTR